MVAEYEKGTVAKDSDNEKKIENVEKCLRGRFRKGRRTAEYWELAEQVCLLLTDLILYIARVIWQLGNGNLGHQSPSSWRPVRTSIPASTCPLGPCFFSAGAGPLVPSVLQSSNKCSSNCWP